MQGKEKKFAEAEMYNNVSSSKNDKICCIDKTNGIFKRRGSIFDPCGTTHAMQILSHSKQISHKDTKSQTAPVELKLCKRL